MMPRHPTASFPGNLVGGNIVLTGFMGTGKSTVGSLLAARLGRTHVDTDHLIEQRHGPIRDIFDDGGEATFRALERDIAAEVADRDGQVISTGGRMLLDRDNVVALSSTGRVWCLTAEPAEVVRRVVGAGDRPLLDGPDPARRVLELLAERTPAYRRFPCVATDGRSPRQVAEDLTRLVLAQPAHHRRDGPGGVVTWIGPSLLPLVRGLPVGEGSSRDLVVASDVAGATDHVPSLGRITSLTVAVPADVVTDDVAVILGGAAFLQSIRRHHHPIVWCPTDTAAVAAAIARAVPGDTIVVDTATVQGTGDLDSARALVMDQTSQRPPVL